MIIGDFKTFLINESSSDYNFIGDIDINDSSDRNKMMHYLLNELSTFLIGKDINSSLDKYQIDIMENLITSYIDITNITNSYNVSYLEFYNDISNRNSDRNLHILKYFLLFIIDKYCETDSIRGKLKEKVFGLIDIYKRGGDTKDIIYEIRDIIKNKSA